MSHLLHMWNLASLFQHVWPKLFSMERTIETTVLADLETGMTCAFSEIFPASKLHLRSFLQCLKIQSEGIGNQYETDA